MMRPELADGEIQLNSRYILDISTLQPLTQKITIDHSTAFDPIRGINQLRSLLSAYEISLPEGMMSQVEGLLQRLELLVQEVRDLAISTDANYNEQELLRTQLDKFLFKWIGKVYGEFEFGVLKLG